MNRAYLYELLPNRKQKEQINNTIGAARFLYNFYRAFRKANYYFLGISVSKNKCYEIYNDHIKSGYSFLKEVDSLALANSEINLDRAFSNFYRDKKSGFPKFKCKHKAKLSYTTNNQKGSIRIIDNSHIKLPKLGIVKINLHRNIPLDFAIKSATITKTRKGKYIISILLYKEIEIKKIKPKNILGLDYSSSSLYVDSNGNVANHTKHYRINESKLARETRKLSKCKLGSNNYKKQRARKNRIDEKVKNNRKDFLHKESRRLANFYDAIIVEDINLRNLSQTLSLGKSTSDNGFGMFRFFLQYKLEELGKHFIKIDKFFPSSKTCSSCGYKKKKLSLGDRIFKCNNCNTIIDRDYNAALNIRNEGIKILGLA